tara:strand:+ start:1169 stop:1894 length:726 start_codon:yes stop_codon:yes gene_type:complete
MRLSLILFSSVFFLISHFISAQTKKDWVQANESNTNWENWSANVPVAGDLRVGLMTGKNGILKNPDSFYLLVPATEIPLVCVQIKSVDGHYIGNPLVFDITQLQPGIREFQFPTLYKEELSKYRKNEVSILAELKFDCSKTSKNFLLASWDKNFKAGNILLFLNSRRPAKLILVENNKIIDQFKCGSILNTEKSVITFNKTCKIPINLITKSTKLMVRQSSGRPNSSPKDFEIPILLPEKL